MGIIILILLVAILMWLFGNKQIAKVGKYIFRGTIGITIFVIIGEIL